MTIWSGKWWSEQYPAIFAQGIVGVELPEDVTQANDTEVNIRMKYTGMYMNGREENFVSKATYENGYINMSVSYGAGTLSYSVYMVDENTLTGTYSLSNPADRGRVEIKKGNMSNNASDQSCIIS